MPVGVIAQIRTRTRTCTCTRRRGGRGGRSFVNPHPRVPIFTGARLADCGHPSKRNTPVTQQNQQPADFKKSPRRHQTGHKFSAVYGDSHDISHVTHTTRRTALFSVGGHASACYHLANASDWFTRIRARNGPRRKISSGSCSCRRWSGYGHQGNPSAAEAAGRHQGSASIR
jgi:hypothetical protein